ncbi:MAG: hypothetical protein LBC37_00930 [Zoogloeaceae bacterium]|jgi:hypothetical protein|nr:hypothetical protein [Zoogloeaceae bacterium]
MKFVAVLAYALLGVVVLFFFWLLAGKIVWMVLPITLLFLVSLCFPAPLGATTWLAKYIQSLRSTLHYGFCYLVVPVGVSVLLVAHDYFKTYPDIGSMLRGIAAFLLVLPVIFLLRENWRSIKLPAYFLVVFLFGAYTIQWSPPNAWVMGSLMARAWLAQLSGAPFRDSDIQYTVVGETDGILFVSLPPTMLFISAQEKPYCIGHPQDAVRGCQKTLEQLIHSQSFLPPAAREK